MINSGAIVQLVAAAFFVVVGIRMLLLSRRTGQDPEKLLGVYFVVTGLSYALWQLPEFLALDLTGSPIDLGSWTLYSIGVVPFMLFARMVFRPDTAWATWLVRSCTVLLFTGITMWIIQGQGYYALGNPWFWVVWLGYTVPCLWLTIEAFLAHISANRRVRVGLCDRVVANRYLLFALFGAFQSFACVTDVFLAATTTAAEIVTGLSFLLGVLEMVGIVTLFLAFFPPNFYLGWLTSRTAADSVEG